MKVDSLICTFTSEESKKIALRDELLGLAIAEHKLQWSSCMITSSNQLDLSKNSMMNFHVRFNINRLLNIQNCLLQGFTQAPKAAACPTA